MKDFKDKDVWQEAKKAFLNVLPYYNKYLPDGLDRNFSTNGKISKLILKKYRRGVCVLSVEQCQRLVVLIRNSDFRHTYTDYDKKIKNTPRKVLHNEIKNIFKS